MAGGPTATPGKGRRGEARSNNTNTTPAKSGGKIKQAISSEPWVRAMRFVIALVAAVLLYHAAKRFMAGDLKPTDAWLTGMIGALGLTAFVEAMWPEGDHRLLQFWGLTTLAASALVAWAMGGEKWIGILGAVTLAISFFIAAGYSAGRRKNDAA